MKSTVDARSDSSWEEEAFAEDAARPFGAFIWPPRSYLCSFCRREFRSAQALGGHMNVHRRERAKLKTNPNPPPSLHSFFHNQGFHFQASCKPRFDETYENQLLSLARNLKPTFSPRVSVSPTVLKHDNESPYSRSSSSHDPSLLKIFGLVSTEMKDELKGERAKVNQDKRDSIKVSETSLSSNSTFGTKNDTASCKRQRMDESSLQIMGLRAGASANSLDLELRLGVK